MTIPTRDMKNLHANGSASLSELREFLAGLKTRKPQEVIGIVSASLLMQSMALATAATVGILVVFSVGPYLIYGAPQAKASTAKGAKPASAMASPAGDPKGTPTANANATLDTPAKSGPDAAKAVKAMGLDETKPADPKKNPLDSPNLDKLLDGLDK
jgi:hypothetical protein